jgi:predicted signal transduction protein with EAL and GGDEF domain
MTPSAMCRATRSWPPSAWLQSTVREGDFVGRYGGEEFIVLLPDTSLELAVEVAERIRAAIADLHVLDGDRTPTASFGVAVFPDHAPDATRLVRCADRALYQAKANGRNRIEVFTLEPDGNGEAGALGESRVPDRSTPLPAERRPAPSDHSDPA